jgi:HEPN domain-containing protein
MKASTREWIKKAESDWQAALSLSRKRKPPFHDEVCFHCQQSAEKYLKARLEEAGVYIPKTHDIERVLSLCLPLEPLWAALQPAAQALTDYGVDFRYPGDDASAKNAKDALKDAKSVRREARIAFGLKP